MLLHVKNQGNMMDKQEKDGIMARVNQLVKNPNVKANVERYFGR